MTKNKDRPKRRKSKISQIRYDPTMCTYSVPDSELQRLQGKYPYDDTQAAITQAGEHTRGYPENVRQAIEANPRRVLELDLQLWLFRAQPERRAETLSELANEVRLCPTFVREALTGEIDMKLARRDLEKFYPIYRELGGAGFEPADDAAIGLVRLLESCGEQRKLPRLQEIDIKILKHLNTAEFTEIQTDLETELKVSRQTVGRRLKYLRELGLTYRPRGQAGGEAISKQGKDFLKKQI